MDKIDIEKTRKNLEQLFVDEFEASGLTIKEWASLALEIISKMLKDYWMG